MKYVSAMDLKSEVIPTHIKEEDSMTISMIKFKFEPKDDPEYKHGDSFWHQNINNSNADDGNIPMVIPVWKV